MVDTVTIRGVELNAEDLLTAAQAVKEQPSGEGDAVQAGSVVVGDDRHDDPDVNVIDVEGGTVSTHRNVDEIIEMAEEAITPPFVDYLKQETDVMTQTNDFEEMSGGARVIYEEEQHRRPGIVFRQRELRSLDEDPNVRLGELTTDQDEYVLEVHDERE